MRFHHVQFCSFRALEEDAAHFAWGVGCVCDDVVTNVSVLQVVPQCGELLELHVTELACVADLVLRSLSVS